MTTAAVLDNPAAIVRRVQTILDSLCKRKSYRLRIPKDGYRILEHYLIISARPNRAGVRAYDHVELLSAAEKQLRRQGIENVVLVPVLE